MFDEKSAVVCGVTAKNLDTRTLRFLGPGAGPSEKKSHTLAKSFRLVLDQRPECLTLYQIRRDGQYTL